MYLNNKKAKQTKQTKTYVFATIHPHSHTIDPHSRTIDPHSRTIDRHSRTIDPHSRTIDPHSPTIDSHSPTIDPHSRLYSKIIYFYIYLIRVISHFLYDGQKMVHSLAR